MSFVHDAPDLMIERGGVVTLTEVTNGASTNKRPTAPRRRSDERPPREPRAADHAS